MVACVSDPSGSEPHAATSTGGSPQTHDDGWLWPIPGADGVDWVINNYVDLRQGSPAMEDYAGGTDSDAKTYDDHAGIDIDIAHFRAMDAGVEVVAAVGGDVIATTDGEFDRQTACVSNDWNVVTIASDDGYEMYYGHLRNGSVAVSVGDRVDAGDALGEVGSSGCSTGPHLHFEVWDRNTLVDPFQDDLFAAPPAYDTPATLMDGMLQAGGFQDLLDVQDPGPQSSQLPAGQPMGIGVSMAGGAAGDELRVELVGTGPAQTMSVVLDQTWRHTFWYWNQTPGVGQWTAEFYVNDVLAQSNGFAVQ